MTVIPYNSDVTRKKTTLYIDEQLLRLARVLGARTGRSDSDVVEAAIRRYVGLEALEAAWARNADLGEDEAMALAVEAVHESRRG
jgi:hypothetical protein